MKRLLIGALALACACSAREYEPNELEISVHRREVYALAREYIVKTFNLQVLDESSFNPVRFNSHGVWGDFEARLKELGEDRFEVQGWISAIGHDRNQIFWAVHIRYTIEDPEGWRFRKVGEVVEHKPEVLGWKFNGNSSLLYEAKYDPLYAARLFQ